MSAAEKMSMRYDLAQDRIKLVGQRGDIVPTLWLTQRLLSRLVVPIFEWLESLDTEPNGGNDSAAKARQQHAALSQLNPGPAAPQPQKAPARALGQHSEAGGDFLVREIDVRRSDSEIMLIFQLSNRQTVRIPFREDQLRRWLNALYKLWRQAEWRNEVWPDWMHKAMIKQLEISNRDPVH